MNSAGFLLIVVAFVFIYLVLIRPQKRRQVHSRQMLANLAPGDEVVTAGGLYGRIVEVRDDEVMIEVAQGMTVKVARRAIGAVIPPPETGELEADGSPPAENGR